MGAGMILEEVQQWAKTTFGPHSQEYGQFVAEVHIVEEFLGALIRRLESHGQVVDIGASDAYMKRLRRNPQRREE